MPTLISVHPVACSEGELIAAARHGDDRAFEELYARYRERITGFIQSRVGDHGRAEDVAQEVFISALRRLRSSDQDIQFKPWIYEIAKNACIDEYRRSRRAREVPLDADDENGAVRPLLSLAPTPPAAIEAKQRLTDLQGAFGGLSESHHQLLVLREFEGLSYEEIGARTGMSRQMVESALFRARRKLTDEYSELASGRRCLQIQATIEDGRAVSARTLGLRERRQFARHLAHCQACRVQARLAGVDDALVAPRSIGAKIAALLPFPILRWPFGAGARAARHAAVRTGTNPATAPTAALLSNPAGPSALGGVAIGAAVLALAGTGAVLAHGGAAANHVRSTAQPVSTTAHHAAARSAAPAIPPTLAPTPAGSLHVGAGTRPGARVSPVHHAVARSSTSTPPAGSRGSSTSRQPQINGVKQAASAISPVTVPDAGNPVVNSTKGAAQGLTETVGSATNTLSREVSGGTQALTSATTQLTGSSTNPVSATVSQVGKAAGAATRSLTNAINHTVDSVTGS